MIYGATAVGCVQAESRRSLRKWRGDVRLPDLLKLVLALPMIRARYAVASHAQALRRRAASAISRTEARCNRSTQGGHGNGRSALRVFTACGAAQAGTGGTIRLSVICDRRASPRVRSALSHPGVYRRTPYINTISYCRADAINIVNNQLVTLNLTCVFVSSYQSSYQFEGRASRDTH